MRTHDGVEEGGRLSVLSYNGHNRRKETTSSWLGWLEQLGEGRGGEGRGGEGREKGGKGGKGGEGRGGHEEGGKEKEEMGEGQGGEGKMGSWEDTLEQEIREDR